MTQDVGDRSPASHDPLRDEIAQQAAEIKRQQATIEQQAAETERLKRRLDDDLLVRDLREAVRLSATAEAIAAPVSHSRLLDMIVATDDRDAADIAEAVGYVPKNILCVPLFYSDQVIGVLELARLVQEIVGHGERETDASRGILQSFAEFLRSRPATAGELGFGAW